MQRIWDMELGDSYPTPTRIVPQSADAVQARGTLRLRPINPETGHYDRSQRLNAAEVHLLGKPASGIDAFYGFRAEFEENEGDVRFRVSTDGGITWKYWDGAMWDDATDNSLDPEIEWNTDQEIDANLIDLSAINGRNPAVAILMNPGGGVRQRRTPEVANVTVYTDGIVDFEEDIMRSVRKHLQGMKVQGLWRSKQDAGETVILLDTDFNVEEPIEAYDLTADPGRTTNLFSSLGPAKTVTLTAPSTGRLEIQYVASPEVFIMRSPNLGLSTIPSVAMSFTGSGEAQEMRDAGRLINWSTARLVATHGEQPVHQIASMVISVQSSDPREADAMQAALARVMQQWRTVTSRATGEEMAIVQFGPTNDGSQMQNKLAVRQTQVSILAPSWVGDLEEAPLVESVLFGFGSINERQTTIEVTAP